MLPILNLLQATPARMIRPKGKRISCIEDIIRQEVFSLRYSALVILMVALIVGAKPLKSPAMRHYLTARTGHGQFTVNDVLT